MNFLEAFTVSALATAFGVCVGQWFAKRERQDDCARADYFEAMASQLWIDYRHERDRADRLQREIIDDGEAWKLGR